MNISQMPINELIDGTSTDTTEFSFDIQMIADGLNGSLQQFIFEPITERTIQDIKNVISVNLSPMLLEAGLMEFSFQDHNIDTDTGAVTLSLDFTTNFTGEHTILDLTFSS